MYSDINERCRADRYQNMGPQPAAALSILSLRPDESAENECREKADQRIEEIPTAKECRKAMGCSPRKMWRYSASTVA
jgi:hypothetical protein